MCTSVRGQNPFETCADDDCAAHATWADVLRIHAAHAAHAAHIHAAHGAQACRARLAQGCTIPCRPCGRCWSCGCCRQRSRLHRPCRPCRSHRPKGHPRAAYAAHPTCLEIVSTHVACAAHSDSTESKKLRPIHESNHAACRPRRPCRPCERRRFRNDERRHSEPRPSTTCRRRPMRARPRPSSPHFAFSTQVCPKKQRRLSPQWVAVR